MGGFGWFFDVWMVSCGPVARWLLLVLVVPGAAWKVGSPAGRGIKTHAINTYSPYRPDKRCQLSLSWRQRRCRCLCLSRCLSRRLLFNFRSTKWQWCFPLRRLCVLIFPFLCSSLFCIPFNVLCVPFLCGFCLPLVWGFITPYATCTRGGRNTLRMRNVRHLPPYRWRSEMNANCFCNRSSFQPRHIYPKILPYQLALISRATATICSKCRKETGRKKLHLRGHCCWVIVYVDRECK